MNMKKQKESDKVLIF